MAAELGYTNASHFSAAFRQQLGMSARDLKGAS
ncbi:AraC family transcriptional regulator [Pandoraea fibrosis]|uniref:AraC family transcriptional regulator n=1 Tax=Pandoraea fibrosis TaxID=1891094 RepID=A0ABX6HWT3_9BURK|nr:AraC family transcriptional regulator [Pandoraea fibrosis]QHF14939.1 AraC family transcriptional regulator [Pandoraea fibrosis]